MIAATVCLTAASGANAAQTPGPKAPSSAIGFYRDIQPILQRHCSGCHNSTQLAGGLDLSSRSSAAQGGNSGFPILGGDLYSNEIYRRVTSGDPDDRMPQSAMPLSADEIELLKVWVAAGTSWPPPAASVDALPSNGTPQPAADMKDWLKRTATEIPYRTTFIVAAVAICGLMLLLEQRYRRLRSILGHDHPGLRRRWDVFLLLWICWGLIIGCVTFHHQLTETRRQLKLLNRQIVEAGTLPGPHRRNTQERVPYGDPPIPQRPPHPSALQHTYFRGNCERGPELFNNGNYRTAKLSISLRDSHGDLVDYNNSVTGHSLVVRFELHRSPATADGLYTDRIMDAVFLSEQNCNGRDILSADQVPDLLKLTEVVPQWKWQADFPLGAPDASGHLDGLIYVYKANRPEAPFFPYTHYGIRYDLATQDGKLTNESEIWMGNLFVTRAVQPPPPPAPAPPAEDLVPLEEWFSHLPIPEIQGDDIEVKEPAETPTR